MVYNSRMTSPLDAQYQALLAEWRATTTIPQIVASLWRLDRIARQNTTDRVWIVRRAQVQESLRAYKADGVDIRAFIPAKDEV